MVRFLTLLAAALNAGLALGQSAEPLPVVVSVVTEAEVNTGFRAVGTVTPLRTSTVGSAVDGRVTEFLVDVGQPIEQGQPLAKLRTETLYIELAAARAELELYQQQLAEKVNGARAEDIAEAEARARGAEAAMDNATANLQRLEALSSSLAASKADLENARERVKLAAAAQAATDAILDRVRQGPRPEQIAQSQAQVDLQSQQVALIEDRIVKHTIIAPFDGYVSAEYTEIGAWISSGDAIAQVIQLDEIEINTPVTADYATKLRRGQAIRVEFPELPDKLLTGVIDRIVPVAESRARTFPVFIRLKNEIRDEAPLLMSGMLARVDLPAGKQAKLPLVPKDALVLNETDRAVFVVEPEVDSAASSGTQIGIVRKVPVSLGVAYGNRIQVKGGLSAGQLVVVVGNERLIPGTRVSIMERQSDDPS